MSAQEPILTRAGQHLHMLHDAMDRLENAGKGQGPEHDELFKRRERLIDLAMACPAQNLRDIAVLTMMISDRANDLEGFTFPTEEVTLIGKNIAMAASSILVVLGTIGVRLDDLGPIDAAYEINRWRNELNPPMSVAREILT